MTRINFSTGNDEIGDPWVNHNRRWNHGWRKYVFPYVFLCYLVDTLSGIEAHSRGNGQLLGALILVAFVACYVFALPATTKPSPAKMYLWLVAAMVCLYLAELPLAQSTTFIMGIFLIVPVLLARSSRSLLLVLGACLAPIVVPLFFPSWHSGPQVSTAESIALSAVALYAYITLLKDSRALAEARTEVARLATENERSRIARDLHDLLGHSLTTIVVKASLARRLFATEPERSLNEITEVEELARLSLSEVRSTVTGYYEVSLITELATAREILGAAGIKTDLPDPADVVLSKHQQLFGWVVREGVTNVVRHSHATHCTIRLSDEVLEIADDGTGGAVCNGNGLRGLRQRVADDGGSLTVESRATGWLLRASFSLDLEASP